MCLPSGTGGLLPKFWVIKIVFITIKIGSFPSFSVFHVKINCNNIYFCSWFFFSRVINITANETDITGINYPRLSPGPSPQENTLCNIGDNLNIIDLNFGESLIVTQNQISGNRIVDITYIFYQIQNNHHDGGFGCSFMNFLHEIRLGFYSEYWFKCKVCNIKQKIKSIKNEPTTDWLINKYVVNSSITIGEYKKI